MCWHAQVQPSYCNFRLILWPAIFISLSEKNIQRVLASLFLVVLWVFQNHNELANIFDAKNQLETAMCHDSTMHESSLSLLFLAETKSSSSTDWAATGWQCWSIQKWPHRRFGPSWKSNHLSDDCWEWQDMNMMLFFFAAFLWRPVMLPWIHQQRLNGWVYWFFSSKSVVVTMQESTEAPQARVEISVLPPSFLFGARL